MILDKKNEAHDQLMKDLFDVAGETAKYYNVVYSLKGQSSLKRAKQLSRAKQRVIATLRRQSIALEPNEIDRLKEIIAAALKVDTHLLAAGFTVVSKGKVAQIATARDANNKFSVDILVESLDNSEYYLNHRSDFADLS